MAMRSKREADQSNQGERRATLTAGAARERIMRAVDDLFYREGVQAVGVDAVIARAGVNKMSLYRNFGSKDQLITAFLEDRNRQYWEWWDAVMQRHDGGPRQKLYGLFEELQARVTRKGYRGCPFVNLAAELSNAKHPARAVIMRNKQELRRRLGELARAAGVKDPDALAGSLILLMEGAYASSQTCGPAGPANSLARTAKALIDAQY
jgi:AcrR family transcriptional regulator